ncbi:hypothetical protein Vi05172_g9894 [Venturia inaequalis]|nr:hypothetical protein Vi05172_g9894 [Venturia inaequalis]
MKFTIALASLAFLATTAFASLVDVPPEKTYQNGCPVTRWGDCPSTCT